jgi:hypothetical protein
LKRRAHRALVGAVLDVVVTASFVAARRARLEAITHRVLVNAMLDVVVKASSGGPPAALPGADEWAQHRA